MQLFDIDSLLGERSAALYLAAGVLSLLKAAVLRGDGNRSRSELRDAALFLGAGLALRWYHRRGSTTDADGSTDDERRSTGLARIGARARGLSP